MARRANSNHLQRAKRAKNDEFYTQLHDIERELKHYKSQFKDKVVYCNCDNPINSNFVNYFVLNYHALGLKKLIASSMGGYELDLLGQADVQPGLFYEYTGEADKQRNAKIKSLRGNGDFRGEECLELLRQADIVVTNPPFSLFREFITLMVKYSKKFLVIGNINAITYKEIFGLIQTNMAWLGVNLGRGISGFIVPEEYELYGTEVSINVKGERIVSSNNCLWLTNLSSPNRKKKLELTKHYSGNEQKYPTYDNFDGINVDSTKDIPIDYEGGMGVPITFLHKYNPEQFEIIRFRKGDDGRDLRVHGRTPYFRILIKRKR